MVRAHVSCLYFSLRKYIFVERFLPYVTLDSPIYVHVFIKNHKIHNGKFWCALTLLPPKSKPR